MRAVLIPAAGEPSVIEHDGSLRALQTLVGGYVEAVDLRDTDGITAWCNEEGLLKGLPVNPTATRVLQQAGCGVELIVGDVVITGMTSAGDTDTLASHETEALLVRCMP